MNQIKKTNGQREKVVFDGSFIISTLPGGLVNIDNVDAKARFADGVIPAGTLIVKASDGKYKVLNAALTAANVKGAVGLTRYDVAIEDYTSAPIVNDANVRTDALPALEKAGVAFIKAEVPTLKFN